MTFVKEGFFLNCKPISIFNRKSNFTAYLEMMIKRTKIWAVVGLLLTFTWSFGQSIDQVVKDLDAERYTAALDGANKLVVSAPSVDTYFLKGYTILSAPDYAKNLKAAQEAFEAGIALNKKGDPLNQVGLGMVKLASKDLAGAKAIFDEVKKDTKSRNADILYRIAEAYTMFPEANDPAEAVLTIDQALERHKTKDNPEYYLVKADAYMLKGDGGAAMNALANAERVGGKLGKTYANTAKIWLQSRNYQGAQEAITKGIAADPSHAPIYKYQSSYFQTFHKYKESADAAANYLKNSDGDVKAKLRYAKLAFIAKDYASLKRVLGEIKGSTDDAYIHRMEGIVNFEEGQFSQAIEDFKKFIAANPKDENFALDYGYIGKSYLKMTGDSAQTALNDSLGLMNIDKAVSINDTIMNIDHYGEAAAILTEKGNFDKASIAAEKGLLAKKEVNAADYATLATSFFRGRNWTKANEYLEKALVEYKDAWPAGYALAGLAKTYRDANDSTKNHLYLGAPDFEKYLSVLGEEGKKNPANQTYVVIALKTLAGRDFSQQKIAEAKAKIEELLTIKPDDTDGQAMFHRFSKLLDPNYVIPETAKDSTGNGR
jgi:tetratricopeptide (TPR) repeat protein